MIIIMDDGGGQMCNKLYNQMNVIASSIEWKTKTKYYNFQKYKSFCYKNPIVESLLECPKKDILHKIYFKVRKVLSNQRFKKFSFGRTIGINDQSIYEKKLKYLSNKDLINNYYFFGWPFSNLPALRKNSQIIREFYNPTEDIIKYIYGKKEPYWKQSVKYIGVHMRRGDYKNWRNGQYYFDDSVYKKYMDKLSKELSPNSCVFFLFSNEKIDDAYFGTEDYTIAIPNGSSEQDFHLLSNMDYIIGPPSTFSGIASFLGKAPRYIMKNKDDILRLTDMCIWLEETDNDGWAIGGAN